LDEGPYAQLLHDLVVDAKEKRASDIHIEPQEAAVEFRLRIDGEITSYKTIGVEHKNSLILEVKRTFGLPIGISGRPQDSRVSFPHLMLDLRVSLLPTLFGEKVVMRLLDLDATFELEKLGFTEDEQIILRKAISYENGVVVISGPTGSGKSKTLYSLLQAVNPKECNVITLEDPVEYRIQGLNQVQISKKISFAEALRSVLRQDPDVILVGEIRDPETARLCFQAAETGHLVFTTLHANGAIEVVERLAGLGVEPLVLESNLRLSLAQRLEQKLCLSCRMPTDKEGLWVREIEGCSACNKGILGRVPILEWALFDAKRLVLARSLAESKLARIRQGDIDCRESK
ncbi:MAG TPA: ATPase, T2SS/T4P/T4SS family, partial [Bdellovibrio sp.]|uniref:GspE/PulE family protein n=1 Tax=Bdellovibrio sp. TaxID=28201 RepID=UPI002F00E0D0